MTQLQTPTTMVPEFDSLTFASAALRTRSFRHQVLASNLSNADTPAYAARDIDFGQALRQAMGSAQQKAISVTHEAHITGSLSRGRSEVLYRVPTQPAVDGNTVEPDVERAHFANNTFGMELAMMSLSSVIRSRQVALSGQV